jgi:hypothetical protein
MDYYIRFERLNEGLRFVCDKVGVEFEANVLPYFKWGFVILIMHWLIFTIKKGLI